MAQTAKAEGEEVKKLQQSKIQNEKTIGALQDDIKRTKQQLDFLKRESLKLRNENNDNQVFRKVPNVYILKVHVFMIIRGTGMGISSQNCSPSFCDIISC